jgi:GTP-binding protein
MCLIGRPNVGKSTMFNYLAGENIAIADNKAGLTWDRNEKNIKLMGGEV